MGLRCVCGGGGGGSGAGGLVWDGGEGGQLIWESNKITINITRRAKRSGDHKAAMNRRKSVTIDIKTQMIHKRSTTLERSVK